MEAEIARHQVPFATEAPATTAGFQFEFDFNNDQPETTASPESEDEEIQEELAKMNETKMQEDIEREEGGLCCFSGENSKDTCGTCYPMSIASYKSLSSNKVGCLKSFAPRRASARGACLAPPIPSASAPPPTRRAPPRIPTAARTRRAATAARASGAARAGTPTSPSPREAMVRRRGTGCQAGTNPRQRKLASEIATTQPLYVSHFAHVTKPRLHQEQVRWLWRHLVPRTPMREGLQGQEGPLQQCLPFHWDRCGHRLLRPEREALLQLPRGVVHDRKHHVLRWRQVRPQLSLRVPQRPAP
ncbi:unnamed protein product [Effrenium voratum]|uniref:Uncharacterized protein n=1 Tax=Effrenium voratum TaxID=2562239 RepID=A0AA36I759_9DINO|nr:unnamed protein product [Effrenium voratum]